MTNKTNNAKTCAQTIERSGNGTLLCSEIHHLTCKEIAQRIERDAFEADYQSPGANHFASLVRKMRDIKEGV